MNLLGAVILILTMSLAPLTASANEAVIREVAESTCIDYIFNKIGSPLTRPALKPRALRTCQAHFEPLVRKCHINWSNKMNRKLAALTDAMERRITVAEARPDLENCLDRAEQNLLPLLRNLKASLKP